jgi:hypothetical protein
MKKKPTPTKRAAPAARAQHEDLAVLLSKVIAHPDLPRVMWNFISDGLCEMDDSFEKYENPEVMREILGLNKKRGAR